MGKRKNKKNKKAPKNESRQPQEPLTSSNSDVVGQSASLKTKSQPAESPQEMLNDVIEFQKNMLQQVDELRAEIKGMSSTLKEGIKDSLDDSYQRTKKRLIEIERSLIEYQDQNLPKKLDAVERSLDLLQGKLVVMDEVREKLDHQLLSTRKDAELQPANEEEQVIADLATYGEQILEVLSRAARHYARNRDVISQSGQETQQAELARVRKESFEEGVLVGRTEVVAKLIDQFDVNTLFDGNSPQDKIIASFLLQFLQEDEHLSEGEIIEISAEERAQFEARAKFTGLGTFEVKISCLKLGQKIIRKAELEAFVPEEEEPDQPSHQ